MFNKIRSSSAVTVCVPPAVYTAGSTISGEVQIDFRELQEEKIEEVYVHLRGTSKTWIHRDKANSWEFITLVNEFASVWQQGQAYPAPGEDILRIPFSLTLPGQLPPSFHFKKVFDKGIIRYSISAVGARTGLLNLNKKHRVPLAVLPRDTIGAEIRAENATHAMKTTSKEEHIRKGLWGDYSKVQVELALPDIPVLPLFSDIPYAITVITTSAPLSKVKADAQSPEKPVFPPAPAAPHDIEFALHRTVRIRAKWMRSSSSGNVALFLGGKESERSSSSGPVALDISGREWAPLDATAKGVGSTEKVKGEDGGSESVSPETKGVWVQRATFEGTFKLTCPPSLSVHNIECNYNLVVKVPFPGIGNDLKLEHPVNVTSGIDQPLAKDSSQPEDTPPILDLPPAYWDIEDNDWGDDEKE